ncbi:hypothetical protein QBC38DRAFT_128270 [Podospora fimiseda]|uniref:Uncharacterized protein n=1 Tax=Podospora fimiseda TaxID=252190 RepID=A0AAN7BSZ0_9PEZI|nr:hypothetical protein QBC38DRAFT_128270 [Podospora fimiseda]
MLSARGLSVNTSAGAQPAMDGCVHAYICFWNISFFFLTFFFFFLSVCAMMVIHGVSPGFSVSNPRSMILVCTIRTDTKRRLLQKASRPSVWGSFHVSWSSRLVRDVRCSKQAGITQVVNGKEVGCCEKASGAILVSPLKNLEPTMGGLIYLKSYSVGTHNHHLPMVKRVQQCRHQDNVSTWNHLHEGLDRVFFFFFCSLLSLVSA